jgi:hypothetical protein
MASPTISVSLLVEKSYNDVSEAGSIDPFRFVSVRSLKLVALVISTRDIWSQVSGRRFTESYRARSRATLNSREMFCRARFDADDPSAMTASVTTMPITTSTIKSSITENPEIERSEVFFCMERSPWLTPLMSGRNSRGVRTPVMFYHGTLTSSSISQQCTTLAGTPPLELPKQRKREIAV